MGSIKVGKLADFTVLYRNPLDVADPDGLRDIKVPGTVMCGKAFPAGPVGGDEASPADKASQTSRTLHSASRGFLACDCELGHEPIAVTLVVLLSLDELPQQLDCRRSVVAVALEIGDEPVLTIDLLFAEGNVLLCASEKIKKRRTVHVE